LGKEEERFAFEEVRESLGIIDQHVVEEIRFWKEKGVKGSDEEICQRIFIGGFSQGCAMSLCYGLSG
jgi:predicted esterase